MSDPIKDIVKYERLSNLTAWGISLPKIKMPRSELLVLNYLRYVSRYNRGTAHVRLSTIKAKTGLHERTLYNSIKSLKKDGYIKMDNSGFKKRRAGRKFIIDKSRLV